MFGKKRGKLGVVIIHNLSAAWQGVSLYVCSRADISEKTERSCLKKVLVRSIIQQRLTSSTVHIHQQWHIWKRFNKFYRQLPSNCLDVLQGFLRQKIMPPDILNLGWTAWFLVILMVIPGSIKRAGQLPIKAKGWIFLRPKICCGQKRTKTTFLNPTNSNWTLSKLSDRRDAWI